MKLEEYLSQLRNYQLLKKFCALCNFSVTVSLMQEDEIGRVCSKRGKGRKAIGFWEESQKETVCHADQNVGATIILKLFFAK
jgi:hypothetical protein